MWFMRFLTETANGKTNSCINAICDMVGRLVQRSQHPRAGNVLINKEKHKRG
jgi:hypothetical protein